MKDRIEQNKILITLITIGIFVSVLLPFMIGPISYSFSDFPKTFFLRTVITLIAPLYMLLIIRDRTYLPKRNILLISICVYLGILGITTLI